MVKPVERNFIGRLGKPVEPLMVDGEIGGTDFLRKAREAGGAAYHGW
jgi:hypothetical protein